MENRNFILAIVLSLAIVLGFQYLMPGQKPVPQPTQMDKANPQTGQAPGAEAAATLAKREDVLAADGDRVTIDTARVKGSINLKGGRIDDLTLRDYHETIDPSSPAIVLLSPSGAEHAYIAETGWLATAPEIKLPGNDTAWTADGKTLNVATPVTLSWSNGDGLTFHRMISIDQNYMFTVKESVTNGTAAPVALRPYALLARFGKPPVSSTWVSYEGPIGAFNGVEEDVKYTAITDATPVQRSSNGGWLGFSDKYWLGAVAPADQGEAVSANFRHSGTDNGQKYQVDYLGSELTAAPGADISHASLVFAGAKEVKLLAAYRDTLHLARFENAVDFGWFWFLTKPIFYVLDKIYSAVGNFGVSILLLTVLMRLIFFPIQTKAVLSMNKMKVLAPEVAKLREKYGEDKAKLNQETMALYQKVGANPVAGCLPILVQIPVFFSLYKVLYVTLEMRHAPFFGWIRDLSAPDPTSIFTLFGLIPWHPPAFLPVLGVWPLIYCTSMYIQQRLQPQPADPVQAKMMQFMPLFFTFMMGGFPAGLVIYWAWSNVLVIGQQYVITHHLIPTKSEPAKA